MRIFTAEVLVLGKTKLGETDLILTLLSSEDRQIRAVAKGARKPGAKLCGISEPFSVFEGKFHVGKSLDIVSEAKALEVYGDIRAGYDRLMAASVALELAAQATNDGDMIPRLYAMTRTFLDVLCVAPEQCLHDLLTGYLLKVLAMIGYSPEYELCTKSERLSELFRSTFAEIAEIEIVEAGIVEAETADVGKGTEEDKGSDTDVRQSARKQIADLRQVMNFTEKHLPARLKSLAYYRKSL